MVVSLLIFKFCDPKLLIGLVSPVRVGAHLASLCSDCSRDSRLAASFPAGLPDPSVFDHRWLEVQVATLTCPQRWVQYLRLLQESIWPGGLLPECPRPARTQAQKAAAEKQALQSLMGVLPGDWTRTLIVPVTLPSHPASPPWPTPFPVF